MEIEGTKFGSITIDRKTYQHDVVIRLSGEVIKRKKKLSKKYYGTSHVLSKDEAKFVFEKGCEQFIIGSGQMGQCASIAGSRSLFCEKGLQGPIGVYPRGDPCVQQITCKEDWAFSRHLLKTIRRFFICTGSKLLGRS